MVKANQELRTFMFEKNISQAKLASILGRRREDINILLGVELSEETKNDWMRKIEDSRYV